MLACERAGGSMRSADRISRVFHRLGLLYAAIPVLAGIYVAYELARGLENHRLAHHRHQRATASSRSFAPLGVLRLRPFSCGRIIRVRLDHVSLAAHATLHTDYGKPRKQGA